MNHVCRRSENEKEKRENTWLWGSLPLPKKSHIVVGSIWNDCSIRRNHLGLSYCNAKGKWQDMKLLYAFGSIKADISKESCLVLLRSNPRL